MNKKVTEILFKNFLNTKKIDKIISTQKRKVKRHIKRKERFLSE